MANQEILGYTSSADGYRVIVRDKDGVRVIKSKFVPSIGAPPSAPKQDAPSSQSTNKESQLPKKAIADRKKNKYEEMTYVNESDQSSRQNRR